MQFVRNGPHLPEHLLQAHENGRVVFFCGAGISRPMLPGFSCLVKRLYNKLKGELTPSQKKELKEELKEELNAGRPDIAFGLLEAAFDRDRTVVRQTLASILKIPPEFTRSTAHECLLKLSKNRDNGCTRLVTTNFDRLFEETIKDQTPQIKRFYAPLLPIPKKQWNGLVYLHGLLPKNPAPSELNDLVVSSGDFGRAYLTERWAARFVSELFRNYIVCFVGYSLNDPVLRYMTDAIAADRQRGESPLDIFAFQSYSKDKKEGQRGKWKGQNVTLILYLEDKEHTHLRKTLQAWSETYRDGVLGKEQIVAKCARMLPLESTKEDDFVGRVMWAISDPSGLPAKHFAELDPVPSLGWLKPLCETRYNRTDLDRFGIPPKTGFPKSDPFSLLHRPSPSNLAPYMSLLSTGAQNGEWDAVMWQLAPWLARHLNDPNLLLKMAGNDRSLHHNLVRLIESRLNKLSRLKLDDNIAELEHIRTNAPNAIPIPPMRTLWRSLLTDRISSASGGTRYTALSLWKDRFKRDGLTTTLRLELRECLTPRVLLHKPINLRTKVGDDSEPRRIGELAGWKIELFANNVLYDLEELSKDKRWIVASPELLTEFNSLLRDVLDLMRELGDANDRSDLSCVLRPSISEHQQNRNRYDWTALISLIRDVWLSTAEQSPKWARCIAEGWSRKPYPLFRRLAFFAAAQGETIPNRQGLDWLLADEHWWLWSAHTRRETMQLLAALAPQLSKTEMEELEKAILNGPPPTTPKNQIDREHQADIIDSEIRLRLTKIEQAGATLNKDGREKLAELCAKHSGRKLDENERDEFSVWNSISWGDGGNTVATPRPLHELIKWLKQHPTSHWLVNGQRTDDDWQERCRDNFATAACALCALAKKGHWPDGRWSLALQVWSEKRLAKHSWRYMAPVLANATDEQLQLFAIELSRWLKAIAETFVGQDEIFLALCKRVLKLKHKERANRSDDPVTDALIHPVGSVTEALLSWWYRRAPGDGQGLPGELELTFTMLCDTNLDKFRHGRVFLAVNLISLFRVNRNWTTKHLLPLFNWQTSEIEACAAWQGFLISTRLYRPLLEVLKTDFLETASHYEVLARYGEEYALLLTFAALDRGDTFETKELATATRALPPRGLHYAAQELVRTIEGAGERRANYWTNRGAPYIREIWPKTRDKISPDITTDLGRVCIAAQEAFPEAFELLKRWLQPTTDSPCYRGHIRLVRQLHETTICSQFPEQALDFIDLVMPKQQCWIPRELRACLEAIQTSKPELERNAKYQQLMERVRQQED